MPAAILPGFFFSLPPVHHRAVLYSMSHLQPSFQGWTDLGGPEQRSRGGAEFRTEHSPSGMGAAKQDRMGVALRSPALSRLDNAREPPDRRAPAPP